jgi:hypothetical protein
MERTMQFTRLGCGTAIAAGLLVAVATASAHAAEATTLSMSVEHNRFSPAELASPAHRPIIIRVKNLDAKPMEFESVSLRVEKVAGAGSEVVIRIRALEPGRYEFFDDFHEQNRGVLVVR